MQPPITFHDLRILLTTSGAAVGAVAAFLTGLLWAFLAEYRHAAPSENTKSAVSVVLPFVLVLVCYSVVVAQGQTPFNEETLWTVLYIAVVSVTGKQIVFAGYRALRPQQASQG